MERSIARMKKEITMLTEEEDELSVASNNLSFDVELLLTSILIALAPLTEEDELSVASNNLSFDVELLLTSILIALSLTVEDKLSIASNNLSLNVELLLCCDSSNRPADDIVIGTRIEGWIEW